MSKISVIVPVYKVEKYLDKCVESIIKQTYKDLEIILVDDGSPDNCPAMCDEWAKKDSRIVVIHKENGGVSSARNKGLDIATGEYVCFVDSDDHVTKDYVEILLSCLEESAADIAVAATQIIGKNQGKMGINNDTFSLDGIDEKQTEIIFKSGLLSGPCCKMLKKIIINDNEIRFPQNIHYGEDTIFIFTYLKFCDKIAFSPKEIYMYATENSVATKKYWPEISRYVFNRFEAFANFFEAHKIEEQIKTRILSDLAFESFEIIAKRNFLKKSVKEYLKEYNAAYRKFSSFIIPPVNKHQYLLSITVDIGKQFLQNKVGRRIKCRK